MLLGYVSASPPQRWIPILYKVLALYSASFSLASLRDEFRPQELFCGAGEASRTAVCYRGCGDDLASG